MNKDPPKFLKVKYNLARTFHKDSISKNEKKKRENMNIEKCFKFKSMGGGGRGRGRY